MAIDTMLTEMQILNGPSLFDLFLSLYDGRKSRDGRLVTFQIPYNNESPKVIDANCQIESIVSVGENVILTGAMELGTVGFGRELHTMIATYNPETRKGKLEVDRGKGHKKGLLVINIRRQRAASTVRFDFGGSPGVKREVISHDKSHIQEKPLPVTPLTRNKHGHYVMEVTGRDLIGIEEALGLEADGFRLNEFARDCILSTNPDSYDRNHRLEEGKIYKVALIPGREFTGLRTTRNLQAYASKLGYTNPLAGIQPRIRELMADMQMKLMGIEYIAALHNPIKDTCGDACFLSSHRTDGGRWLRADWVKPRQEWNGRGAFAFIVPH